MRVTIDLMKKSTQIIDLSNVINPRVGDDDLQLPLHIGYGDNLFDMRGKDVEFLSNDPNQKNIYIAGTCSTDTPGDNLYMGDLTFRFPAGTFQADGTYDPDKTMFRIVDKATQKVISSVNVKITVMKNALEFNFDPDKSSYDSRAETMLQDFHDKGQAMLDAINDLNNQAKSNVSGDTAATANEAKQQANANAGDISDLKGEVTGARGRFANMADREDAQDTAISQKETIVNANANYAALQQKDAQQDTELAQKESFVNANANYTALQQKDAQQDAELAQKASRNELEDKLAQMDLKPEGFRNLDDLKAKYPNGNANINVTADNGHMQLWINGSWTDCGQYQGVALAESDRQQLDNALAGDNVLADASSEPYNDLDKLPINRVVTYASDISSLKNAPDILSGSSHGATVVTMAINPKTNSGAVQMLFTSNGEMHYRIAWGDPATYGSWNSIQNGNYVQYSGTNVPDTYKDLNTFPINSEVLITDNIGNLKNIPSQLSGASYAAAISTESVGNNYSGTVQKLFVVETNDLYERLAWGGDNTYRPWRLLADGDFYKPGKITGVKTGSPYDDLNTFPVGQTITIAESPDVIRQIKNLPPISNAVGGLTVRTESANNSNIGGIQIAIDTDNVMHHRICWGAVGRWGAWRSDSVDENSNGLILPTLSLFQKVGVVGDSYASGELAFDGKNIDHYEISWLQILARKYGFTGTNFSLGGMSTRTWLTNPKCMPLMQSSDAQDLYILALGINDEALGTSYIGSESDIDNGADTFYGNYGKIIKAIQAKAPQAKLVIATIADSSDTATQFNQAITTIANHFSIPVIVQLDDPLFNSSLYKDNMVGGHPTGPVYASMAEAFERLIGQSMIDHLDYYKTFKKDA